MKFDGWLHEYFLTSVYVPYARNGSQFRKNAVCIISSKVTLTSSIRFKQCLANDSNLKEETRTRNWRIQNHLIFKNLTNMLWQYMPTLNASSVRTPILEAERIARKLWTSLRMLDLSSQNSLSALTAVKFQLRTVRNTGRISLSSNASIVAPQLNGFAGEIPTSASLATSANVTEIM